MAGLTVSPLVPLGLDIAQHSFVAGLRLPAGKRRQRKFDNTRAGFQALQAWLQHHEVGQVHACLEATGT